MDKFKDKSEVPNTTLSDAMKGKERPEIREVLRLVDRPYQGSQSESLLVPTDGATSIYLRLGLESVVLNFDQIKAKITEWSKKN